MPARVSTTPRGQTINTLLEDNEQPTTLEQALSSSDPAYVLAAMRQFRPDVQQHIYDLVVKALELGVGVHDVDRLSGNTLLHFAVRAGARGMTGQPAQTPGKKMADKVTSKYSHTTRETPASQAISLLLRRGASVAACGVWTGMNALHMAAFFGYAEGLHLLLGHSREAAATAMVAKCEAFEGATPLHLAAMSGNLECVKVLLQHGASTTIRDNAGRTAHQCATLVHARQQGQEENTSPSNDTSSGQPTASTWSKLLRALEGAQKQPLTPKSRTPSSTPAKARAHSSASATPKSKTPAKRQALMMDVPEVGDRVRVVGRGCGLVVFKGEVHTRPGTTLGIELDEPKGTHNGTVDGIVYFHCKDRYGVMVAPSRAEVLAKSAAVPNTPVMRQNKASKTSTPVTTRRRPVSNAASPRSGQGTPRSVSATPRRRYNDTLELGSRIMTSGKVGRLRFIGSTQFADGTWLGIELDEPTGKNDGSVKDVRYFECKTNHGLFVRPSAAFVHGIKCSEFVAA